MKTSTEKICKTILKIENEVGARIKRNGDVAIHWGITNRQLKRANLLYKVLRERSVWYRMILKGQRYFQVFFDEKTREVICRES